MLTRVIPNNVRDLSGSLAEVSWKVDQTRLPSYRIGMQQGIQQGEEKALERLLTRRFGPLSENVLQRLKSADLDQLESWVDNILDAKTLEDVFNI